MWMLSCPFIVAALGGLGFAYLMSLVLPRLDVAKFSRKAPPFASTIRQSYHALPKAQYHRIRIQSVEDIDKSYPLLIDYLKQPAVTPPLKELVLDCPIREKGCSLFREKKTQKDVAIQSNAEEEELINEAIRGLGLKDKAEKGVQDVLIWKSREHHTNDYDQRTDSSIEASRRRAKYGQAAAAIYLLLCPIERFKVSWMSTPLQQFIMNANYGALPTPHLQYLRHVIFVPNNDKVPFYDERYYSRFDILGQMRLFHRLPNIESIEVDRICEDPNSPTTLPPHTSNLKKIHIGHSDLSSQTLAFVIRLPKSLEEFEFSIGGLATVDGGFSQMFPKTLGKAFLTQKQSLRVLDLDVDGYLRYSPHNGEEQEDECEPYYSGREDEADSLQRDEWFELDEKISKGPLFTTNLTNDRPYGRTMGSLHDFNALTHLSIGVKLLLGPGAKAPFRLVDALPKALEYLCIRGYKAGENEEYTNQINELMEKKGEKLPNLREVKGVESEIPSADMYDSMDWGDVEESQLESSWTEEEEEDGWLEL